MALKDKESFIRLTRHAFGRTALVLSGGGALGAFHLVRVSGSQYGSAYLRILQMLHNTTDINGGKTLTDCLHVVLHEPVSAYVMVHMVWSCALIISEHSKQKSLRAVPVAGSLSSIVFERPAATCHGWKQCWLYRYIASLSNCSLPTASSVLSCITTCALMHHNTFLTFSLSPYLCQVEHQSLALECSALSTHCTNLHIVSLYVVNVLSC